MISVQCVDSLQIFRKIDEDNKKFTEFLDSELAEIEEAEKLELSDMLEQDSLAELGILAAPNTSLNDCDNSVTTTRAPSPELFEDCTIDDETLTQLTEEAEHKYNADATTPVNKKIRITSPPKIQPKQQMRKPIDRSRFKPRMLFKPSYKLTSIYERFFNHPPPVAHRAEEDTIMLFKCARFHAKDFLMNIPNFAKDLQSYVK